ncbi:MAG: 50S ribosomal protein L34 [Candidatus Levybacteria bacterium RIFCSPLOWO2_02_FULL_37_10]|nr:MAG: 50S ribosomal protein L34 [Candidatus Levybacteria bacterium RIFCSPHIGHO2_01_FULL_37_33]OGH16662.1 MAG: 50S ribosomal protein L34 [Candidatus Levybacteria bacterium RIFCSPHIGHO2_02_FULL_37_11]OGH29354.1 MAG: 50S ribosomal protein L34 [Candidatus Levybacteria bacterium RIFCSPHIGHO2_12_FULL_37_12]OGH32488.1 MAG: 50S ribosomal protein L34 [Candidatus Levybacteria bacterium RIFCSPLOWO2_01_FULL_36_54]OGH45764.1 MAG: 50S ribosomal protein L34 [Candidatus Levybacteria bacterium RIFCSPLOWO2_02_
MERLTKSKKLKRKRKHGFLQRKGTHGGKKVIRRRRQKGRKRIAI